MASLAFPSSLPMAHSDGFSAFDMVFDMAGAVGVIGGGENVFAEAVAVLLATAITMPILYGLMKRPG